MWNFISTQQKKTKNPIMLFLAQKEGIIHIKALARYISLAPHPIYHTHTHAATWLRLERLCEQAAKQALKAERHLISPHRPRFKSRTRPENQDPTLWLIFNDLEGEEGRPPPPPPQKTLEEDVSLSTGERPCRLLQFE